MIHINDAEFDHEERNQKLLPQVRESNGEMSDRVLDPNPPTGNKAIGGMLAGLLMAAVSPANFTKLMEFLSDRLGSKAIKVEANGEKLKGKASIRQELEATIAAAQNFIAA